MRSMKRATFCMQNVKNAFRQGGQQEQQPAECQAAEWHAMPTTDTTNQRTGHSKVAATYLYKP